MLGTQGCDVTLFNYAAHHGLDFPLNLLAENRGLFTDDFAAWLPKNLHIFAEFCKIARDVRRRGVKHYGAGSIAEIIRYHTILHGKPEEKETFKLNNNYRAYLARLCMIAYPETDGLFETREAKKVYQNGTEL